MKTSARNQFSGKVTKVSRGAVNDEVELQIAAGEHIVAVIPLPHGGSVASIITNDSATTLDLKVGSAASAIFKASSVILAVPR